MSSGGNPRVTVLMPVYNGERYLREAVESILGQTFGDFEFLVIDDGSTDGSAEIVASYQDPRIRLLHNGRNLGLVATLNRGIDTATGEYIARMDCDDVSLPERLEKQVAHLDANAACAVVAAKVVFIDEEGKPLGTWREDAATTSVEEIRTYLPKANCIAHPTAMIRSGILRRYRYHPEQVASEDYDLWLRLVSDGVMIEKLPETVLKYRVNPLSVTSVSNRALAESKQVRTKILYLRERLGGGRLNLFDLRVLLTLPRDVWYLCGKRSAERLFGITWTDNKDQLAVRINRSRLFRWIIGAAGLVGSIVPFKNSSSLFFFFPFCHVGGAERVHADVVACFSCRRPWVFFTKRSDNDKFRGFFSGGRTFDLWRFCKYGYPLSVGIMAGFVNRHKNAVVVGSNSLFYYLLLPYLKPNVRKIDLLHAFGAGIEDYSLPAAPLLDARVVISAKTAEDLRRQYRETGTPEGLAERIGVIVNKVSVPEAPTAKSATSRLSVLYVGRGTAEKRVHLVGRIASLCRDRGVPADFLLVGETMAAVAPEDRGSCAFAGEVTSPEELGRLYAAADLLLLTSSREGFPMVIMEGMAQGVVPIVTAVGGIPDHVREGVTGWLVRSGDDEERIVTEIGSAIERLAADRTTLNRMSRSAYDYARENFGGKRFCSGWRDVVGCSDRRLGKGA